LAEEVPAALAAEAPATPTPAPEAPPAAPLASPDVVDELARSLEDPVTRVSDAWLHYQAVLTELGAATAKALVAKARTVQANGGLTVELGERKRTLGGVFFALAREEAGPVKWREIRKAVRKRAHKAKAPPPKPLRFEPEVLVRRRGAW